MSDKTNNENPTSESEADENVAADENEDQATTSAEDAEREDASSEEAADDAGSDDAGDDDAGDDDAGDDDAGDDDAGDDDAGDEEEDDAEEDAEPKAINLDELPWDDGEGQGALYGYLAEFDTPGELIEGAEKVRDNGFQKWDCYSPFPVHGIDPAMGIKRTKLPWVVFCGGIAGLIGGMGLQWWANDFHWPWLVSGKPFWSIPANIPIAFETTVLLSALTCFFAMWIMNDLPRPFHPFFRNDRFRKVTDDGMFIGIEADDPHFDGANTRKMLLEAGASHVEPCYYDPDPRKKVVPKPIVGFIVATTILAVLPFACISKVRSEKSTKPHWHIIPDMDFQFKRKAQTATDLFADGRTTRPRIAGTIAFDPDARASNRLAYNREYNEGVKPGKAKAPDTFLVGFPSELAVDRKNMLRGQNRYNIFCAPCHGVGGDGLGPVHKRALTVAGTWIAPTSLHSPGVITQPHGQIFDTVSKGLRSMPGYGGRTSVADRWAIVLYVRALQRAKNASIADVAPAKRGAILPPPKGAKDPTKKPAAPTKPAPTKPAPKKDDAKKVDAAKAKPDAANPKAVVPAAKKPAAAPAPKKPAAAPPKKAAPTPVPVKKTAPATRAPAKRGNP